MNKVFLGGTYGDTSWRNILIPILKINYFNPIVSNWTTECQKKEIFEKEKECNIHLYVITKEMKGVFSIAEAIESVHMNNKTTILHIIPDGFNTNELKSLEAVLNMVIKHGGIGYIDNDIYRTARVINYSFGNYNK